jgi:inorganic pyrophosphatase
MRLDAIAIGKNPPHDVNVIIEVPIGGEPIKYEMDKAAGTLVVDRFLHTPMRYPGDYGFIPHTLSEDGDPIDVLVANTRPIVPGAVINVRPIGVLKMMDDAGGDRRSWPTTPKLTKRYARSTTPICPASPGAGQHFFEHYKDLEPGKWVRRTAGGCQDAPRRSPRRHRAGQDQGLAPFAAAAGLAMLLTKWTPLRRKNCATLRVRRFIDPLERM